MSVLITHVDAFTKEPFSGNPAAVCLLTHPRDKQWMQNVAREMNLSETAFLLRSNDGFDLRWFTPKTEVDLCGHATLASAHVLWEQRHIDVREAARFHTRSGWLTAEKKGDWIEMDFPARNVQQVAAVDALEAALKVKPRFVGRAGDNYLVEVGTESEVRNLDPDFSILRKMDAYGFIVTSHASTSEFDFVSRFFAPKFRVDEDPVTGSAHCSLGPFWKERLGRDGLTGFQASARGGVVGTRCVGNRVLLSGQAVTVLHGELLLPTR